MSDDDLDNFDETISFKIKKEPEKDEEHKSLNKSIQKSSQKSVQKSTNSHIRNKKSVQIDSPQASEHGEEIMVNEKVIQSIKQQEPQKIQEECKQQQQTDIKYHYDEVNLKLQNSDKQVQQLKVFIKEGRTEEEKKLILNTIQGTFKKKLNNDESEDSVIIQETVKIDLPQKQEDSSVEIQESIQLPKKLNQDDSIQIQDSVNLGQLQYQNRNDSYDIQILDSIDMGGKQIIQNKLNQKYNQDQEDDDGISQAKSIFFEDFSNKGGIQIEITENDPADQTRKGDENMSFKIKKGKQLKEKKEKIGLNAIDPQSQDFFDKMQDLLTQNYQYTEIEKLGNGAFGLVMSAKTKEGFSRAIKAQIIKPGEDDVEYKFAKIMDESGAETLFGNTLKVFKAFNIVDEETGVKISVLELQLADDSLKGWLDSKIQGKEMSDDEFSSVCIQLINNVIAMHTKEIVHRDIKPGNILRIGDFFFFADFGESEQLDNKEVFTNDISDCLLVEDYIKGTPRYLAPIIRKQYMDKKNFYKPFMHDLFKSDIYSLALVILEILLVKNKFSNQRDIGEILTNPEKAREYAKLNNINKYILGGEKGIILSKGYFYETIFPNILEDMLEIDENKRMNSCKLAMLLNAEELLVTSKIEDPFPLLFRPLLIKKNDKENTIELNYPLRQISYIGQYRYNSQQQIIRNGKGKMIKMKNDSEIVMLDTTWDYDLPSNNKAKLLAFGSQYFYEGDIVQGTLEGKGELYIKQGPKKIVIDKNRIICNIFTNWFKKISLIDYQFQMKMKKENIQHTIFKIIEKSIFCTSMPLLNELLNPVNQQVINQKSIYFSEIKRIDKCKIILYFRKFKLIQFGFAQFYNIFKIVRNYKLIDLKHKFCIRVKYFGEDQVVAEELTELGLFIEDHTFIKFLLNISIVMDILNNFGELLKILKNAKFDQIAILTYKLILSGNVFGDIITEQDAQDNYDMYNLEKIVPFTSSLKICDNQVMDVQIFNLILTALPKNIVTKISFDNCPKIAKQGLLLLFNNMNNIYRSLRTLKIDRIILGQKQIELLFINLPKSLRYLKIIRHDLLQFKYFQNVFMQQNEKPNIYMAISSIQSLNQSMIPGQTLKSLPFYLKELDMSGGQLNYWKFLQILHTSTRFMQLEKIILNNTMVEFPVALKEYDFPLNTLYINLSLVNCPNVHSEGLKLYLEKIQAVQKIKINNIKLLQDQQFLNFIFKNSNIYIVCLLLEQGMDIHIDSISFLREQFAQNEIDFQIYNQNLITFQDYSIRVRMSKLISHQERLSNEEKNRDVQKIFSLRKFLQIKNLDLSDFQIPREVVQELTISTFVQNLEFLDISNNLLTQEDFQMIVKCENLKKLKTLKCLNSAIKISDSKLLEMLYQLKSIQNIYIDDPNRKLTTINLANVNLSIYNERYYNQIKECKFFTDNILISMKEEMISYVQLFKNLNIKHLKVEVDSKNLQTMDMQVFGLLKNKSMGVHTTIMNNMGNKLLSYQIGNHLWFRPDLNEEFQEIKDISKLVIENIDQLRQLQVMTSIIPVTKDEIYTLIFQISVLTKDFINQICDTLIKLNNIWKLYWVEITNKDKRSHLTVRQYLDQKMADINQNEGIHVKIQNLENNLVFY